MSYELFKYGERYVPCGLCGTLRPSTSLVESHCKEVEFCEQARVERRNKEKLQYLTLVQA